MRRSVFIKKANQGSTMQGRGLFAYLASMGLTTTAGKLTTPLAHTVEPAEGDSVRKNLLERMYKNNVDLLTAADLSNGNPDVQKNIEKIENAFYIPAKRAIFLGKNFKGNATLAHEMGHMEDPKWLTQANITGKAVGGVGAMLAAVLGSKRSSKAAALAGSLGFGGTLASEVSASGRGYKIMEDAGEEDVMSKLKTMGGLPSYVMAGLSPLLTYKFRKGFGAFG